MVAVANVRINTQVPFPAQVVGSGPITIGKTVGSVWTVGFNINAFASQAPPAPNYPTDFLLGYDAVANTFFKISISNLANAITLAGPVRTQRLVTASPIVISGSDQIINVNITSGSPTCTLPSAAGRLGAPLTFKDIGGNFAAHNLTLTPAGGDTIDGGGNLVLSVNRQGVTLVPANDGTSTGWFIE